MKKILNVGCGDDSYGTHFIDLYPTRKNVLKCNLDNNKFPFRENFFDEVYCMGVFEHLKNPLNMLKESYRILKKGGKIVIITDNAGLFGWQGKIHHGSYENARKKQGFPNDRHFALFTPNHLKNWLGSVGFHDINIEYFIVKSDVFSFYYKIFLNTISRINKKFSPHIRAVGIK